jgi:flagellar basal-body rod modification protein FlgD
MDAINPLDALKAANASPSAPTRQQGGVSRDSFLNLLVTQLRHQDPLDPVENTEFISQLAQFQSLESQISMRDRLEDLVALQESQLALAGLSQAALLVGKHVTWIDGEGNPGEGTIQTVTVENGVMMVNTENGKVPVAALTSIGLAEPPAGAPSSGSETEPPSGGAAGAPGSPSFKTSGTNPAPALSHANHS